MTGRDWIELAGIFAVVCVVLGAIGAIAANEIRRDGEGR